MNIHKAGFSNHAKRISDYFEMCCFNYIVKFYKAKGYEIEIENLQSGNYRYKCSTQGNQENFSNFKISKTLGDVKHEFGIYHNLAVESYHEKLIYTTPDISVIKHGKIEHNQDHYGGSKKLSYVANENIVTFCEVKQFYPFPELMFNFIGTINELKHDIMSNKQTTLSPVHIAPSLMVSGKPNPHTLKIKESLEARYCINIIYDLFVSTSHPFSKHQIGNLKTIQTTKVVTDSR